jgi:hypothetical protein
MFFAGRWRRGAIRFGISFVNFTNHHQPREGTMVKKKLFAELLNGTGIAPGILLR